MELAEAMERIMMLFVAFFIVVTGVHVLPQVANYSPNIIFLTFYALSIPMSCIYFILNAISKDSGGKNNE